MVQALSAFAGDLRAGRLSTPEHGYSIPEHELARLRGLG
jgi:hypothetical protein